MDIESLCESFNKKVSFFENEEYFALKDNYNLLQTNFNFDKDFYEKGLKRYEKYLYHIVFEDIIYIEQAIYKYINSNNYSEAFQAMKYIDTEIMKVLGEI